MNITYVFRWVVLILISQLNFANQLQSQDKISNTPYYAVKFSYGLGFPQQLMRQQYGSFNRLTVSAQRTSKQWFIALYGGLNFGSNVKSDPFHNFRSEGGQLLGVQGDYTVVLYRYRARSVGGEFGYFLNGNVTSKSRFLALADLQFQEHYIRFLNDDGGFPLIDTDQRLLHDQARTGFGWAAGVGYQYRFPYREFRVATSFKYRRQNADRRDFRLANDLPNDALFQSLEWSLELIFPLFRGAKNETIYY